MVHIARGIILLLMRFFSVNVFGQNSWEYSILFGVLWSFSNQKVER